MFNNFSDSSKSCDASSRSLDDGKNGSQIHKTTLESQLSATSSGSKQNQHSRELAAADIRRSEEPNKLPEWDSHLNMQKLVTSRTKLETPDSEESIEAYAKACRAKFDRKLAKAKANHVKKVLSKKCVRNQPIYTKPYSSDSYSEIQNIQRSNADCMKRKQSDVYTSVSESDGFLSPNSISIGVAANSTSNTTTHQYDTKISVAVQTNNSLERMPIIQPKKIEGMNENEAAFEDKPTQRVNKLTDKKLQVRPEALAYIIMFKENNGMDEKTDLNIQEKEECSNQLYTNVKKVETINGNNNDCRDPNALKRQSKKTNSYDQAVEIRSRASSNSSNCSSIASADNLTLQECLQARRPDFYANAEQRRKCLNDLHNLR